jgi:hypothetical protein
MIRFGVEATLMNIRHDSRHHGLIQGMDNELNGRYTKDALQDASFHDRSRFKSLIGRSAGTSKPVVKQSRGGVQYDRI